MEFRHFRYILKIAEEGTLSRAAKALYVSQPSLSQLLAAQEKKIGAPLFDRGTRLTPTAVGRRYLEMARSIIALDESFHQQVDDIVRGAAGDVTVGLTQFRSTHLLAPMLPAFRAKYPKITLHLREDTTERLEEMAAAGEMDCMISLLPIDERRFDYDILFEERLLLALPPAHPVCTALGLVPGDRTSLPRVPLAALRETPFLLMHREQKLHDMLLTLCEDEGFVPEIALETRSMNTAHALAGAGLGTAVLPETLIAAAPPAHPPCYAAIEGDPCRMIVLARAKKRYLPRAVSIFREELRTFCSDIQKEQKPL
ncbi:LysR family transcriptional regulator [Selenomonas sp. oral taxon 126]|jgi:transcriptional regulator, LysR family|uniref:LysR family transcriptional regulator n=1 Tax=Selenomonas sp. oral taxon 126 TaxID=712528 RepID=UPI0008079291|nr:LysR family transcriptional regulator [Selenomonas sp. oral taxon 126]ANR69747.1 LysR family transcriptional regulator [Selenomonas sp. oral taxon 126]